VNIMARTSSKRIPRGSFPATALLRGQILIATDPEALVALFAGALAEHGIDGHFCLRKIGKAYLPLLGDAPGLIASPDCLVVDGDGALFSGTRVLLAKPSLPLGSEGLARVRGYAQLFAARAMALQELSEDVQTDCGLSLRERYVLGRRLAGLATLDIALESGISIETVNAATDSAIARLGVTTLPEATSLAARRGWLAVTRLQNCSSSSENLTYKAAQNG
jgi:DNA-binding CsgD family transcriptional regulator